ncbi:type II restriction enzyme [Alkalihalobacterium alkalicellulosilyticum]|uniref:type II restriction enzyme n=1 Tax=Alkalihalobacterium alkalicellulosilyticum TaxID=1912214 RepID=UPI0009968700|nr:hypothetical protein [Bacillus alkalicellulosilyticus]
MTKNDQAWSVLFERHHIVERVRNEGFFRISADDIRKEREPRLMCKFDHSSNLPKLFKEHGYSILPLSRSEYIIGPFSIFENVSYHVQKPTRVAVPSYIDTVNTSDLYSESAALHAAFVSGMFHHVLDLAEDAPLLPTVSGRMGSKQFDYHVAIKDGIFPVQVEGSQIEIDGGYEGINDFVIVEAKKEGVTDFNIRQLYYPYRVWKKRTKKNVIPVFFTHSNDIFSFFVYRFSDDTLFNSIELVKQLDFMIDTEHISVDDLLELCKRTSPNFTGKDVPFPQADSFERVVDLLHLLHESTLEKDVITENYDFTPRQSDYYTNIGRFFDLIDKQVHQGSIFYSLTEKGKNMMGLPYKEKYLALAQCLFSHPVFQKVFLEWILQESLSKDRVVTIMKQHNLGISAESTYYRRAQTILKWMEWLKKLTER